MSQISQKEAVVIEVKSILGSNFDTSLPAKDQLSKSQLETIKNNVVNDIINNKIFYSKDVVDLKNVTKYVAGMMSNHFRKAKELNGGVVYSPQASNRGSKDSQISELNKLLKTLDKDCKEYLQVIDAIAARKAIIALKNNEILKEKKKKKELTSIDTSILPENLKDFANTLIGESV